MYLPYALEMSATRPVTVFVVTGAVAGESVVDAHCNPNS